MVDGGRIKVITKIDRVIKILVDNKWSQRERHTLLKAKSRAMLNDVNDPTPRFAIASHCNAYY